MKAIEIKICLTEAATKIDCPSIPANKLAAAVARFAQCHNGPEKALMFAYLTNACAVLAEDEAVKAQCRLKTRFSVNGPPIHPL